MSAFSHLLAELHARAYSLGKLTESDLELLSSVVQDLHTVTLMREYGMAEFCAWSEEDRPFSQLWAVDTVT